MRLSQFNLKTIAGILLVVFITTPVSAQKTVIDTSCLTTNRLNLQNGTASQLTKLAYSRLLKKADLFLTIENPSVMNKQMTPPSGDKHDYMSLSRYWWPNPDTPDHLPWIRKDGETNPDTQTDVVDRQRIGRMAEGVWHLSLAYFYTKDLRYAEKAVSMIETWFFNEETYMNPNLNYAQGVPGRNHGKASGVLDGRLVPLYIPDAITLLKSSKLWTNDHQNKIVNWLEEYLDWLINSDLGKAESVQPNNHGTWYKYQIIALASYLDKKRLANEYMDLTIKSLDDQMTDEGAQTHELERTRSFFYSCYNLQALFKIDEVGRNLGFDLKNYKTEKNRGFALAISYMTPVLQGKPWPYPSLNGVDITLLAPILFHMVTEEEREEYRVLLPETIDALTKKGFESRSANKILQELWLVNCFDSFTKAP